MNILPLHGSDRSDHAHQNHPSSQSFALPNDIGDYGDYFSFSSHRATRNTIDVLLQQYVALSECCAK